MAEGAYRQAQLAGSADATQNTQAMRQNKARSRPSIRKSVR